jgi:O-methyltransferase
MTTRTLQVNDRLARYMVETSVREPEILQRLREETARLGDHAGMQISPEQGQFLALLVELTGARRLLEVGTFTGYSALVCALSMPPDGEIVCCDISEEYTAIALSFWGEAGVSDIIELRLGPARETLNTLLKEGQADSFDFAFIDADKANYDSYYECALRLVRPGGLIIFDNVLWGGKVADPAARDADTEALRRLNDKLLGDARVSISLVPIGDGMTLARRRP